MSDKQWQGEREPQEERESDVPMATESKLEEIAEDVGRLLGAAKVKADGLIEQGQSVAKRLETVRDAASGLITQLTGGAAQDESVKSNRVVGVIQPAPLSKRQRRKLSPEARAGNAEALQARWARHQAEAHGGGRRKG
jgi:hypothetical protein